MLETMADAPTTTTASPSAARRTSRRFPSRNASAIPMGNRASAYGISSGSTTEIPAASSQYTAGPANGKRRQAKTGSTRVAIAGTQNQSVVSGAPGEPRPSTTSSMAAIARTATST